MSLHRVGAVLAVLVVLQIGAVLSAVDLPALRVVDAEAKVFERPTSKSHVMAIAMSGAVLEIVDKERDWYWVLLDPDEHGTRRAGWIQARHVEIAVPGSRHNALRGVTGEADDATTATERPEPDDREGRQEARKAEQEAKQEARRAEQEAKQEARRAEQEARQEARRAEREARQEAKRAEREARLDAKRAEQLARDQARLVAAARKLEEARREVEAAQLKADGRPVP